MKKCVFYLFSGILGGAVYVLLECLFRGFSDISMFFAGGICFVLLQICCNGYAESRPLWFKCLLGACIITVVEGAFGLLLNGTHRVWDYSDFPLNWRGQICVPFSVLWGLLSIPAMRLGRSLKKLGIRLSLLK